MKKDFLLFVLKINFIVLLACGIVSGADAQIINEGFEEPNWIAGIAANAGYTTSGQINITNTAAASIMSYYTSSNSFTTAVNTNPNSGIWWYSRASTATDSKLGKVHSASYAARLYSSGYLITPLTSSAVASVVFWASLGSQMNVGIAFDPNVTQPTYSSSSLMPLKFTNFSTSFSQDPNMRSYSIAYPNISGPVRIGFFNYGSGSTYIDDILIMQPTGSPPAITTGTVVPGTTDAKVNGIVSPGSLPLMASGIIWSTTPLTGTRADTALITKTWKRPSAMSSFTDAIKPLLPSTTYYAEAYVIGLDNSVYLGSVKTFTTKGIGVPTVDLKINNIYSYKADVSGVNLDSCGVHVTEKGFIFNRTGNPQIGASGTTTIVSSSQGSADFTELIKNLIPNTNYCIKAYAKNSIGVGYSKDSCFTTGTVVPYLTAIQGVIDLGPNYFGAQPTVSSYILNSTNLATDTGTITVTCPAPFKISTQPSTGFSSTLIIHYSGGKLNATTIYVELPTNLFGNWGYTSALYITHPGGGVAAADADMVKISGSIEQSPDIISNKGVDFWLGYAFEERMKNILSVDSVDLIVYISGTPGTNVTVEAPLLSVPFSRKVVIPSSGVASVNNFPRGDGNDPTNVYGFPDTRLYYTGVSNRGIHVYSDGNPVSVWMYDYATNNSAGGSLIVPATSWGSDYVVQSYGNITNTGPANSFFFVMAKQDNTPVYFTPSVNIIDSATCATFSNIGTDIPANIKYAAGTKYTVYLNKGQVFTAIGAINAAGFGLDLSGSLVSTDADKKIAVFGGNARCVVNTLVQCPAPISGSDNLVQQNLPSSVWDTKYFTVPTKSMEHNLYRIYVKDATTKVWINDTLHGTAALLINTAGTKSGSTFAGNYTYTSFGSTPGGYYSLETSFPMEIESDQPVSISQFITSGTCTTSPAVYGNNGTGDPEMIILSGAKQNMNNATVYSPSLKNNIAGGAYINVIIPTSGISSFNLDNLIMVDTGSSSFTGIAYGSSSLIPIANAFKPFAANSNYSYARFHVGNGLTGIVHSLSSNIPFNGIAYGCANGESYGFNAGFTNSSLPIDPVISSFSPVSGKPGDTIRITGDRFWSVKTVSFGGVPVRSFIIDSATKITAVVDTGATGNIRIVSGFGGTSLGGFTYICPAPSIISFLSESQLQGGKVVIKGTNFVNVTGVSFGGIAAVSFTVDSDTQITAIVGSGSSGNVSVTNEGGTSIKNGFVYLTPIISPLCPSVANKFISTVITGVQYKWQVSTNGGATFNDITDDSYYSGSATSILQLNGIPSSWYGNQYRCVIDGNYGDITTLQFQDTWTGSVSNNWEDPANWNCGTLPDENTDVIIATGTVNINSNVTCRNLTVKPGVIFTVTPGYTLTILH